MAGRDVNVENLVHESCGSSDHDEDNEKDKEAKPVPIPDCPVCLQTCSYPVKLACGHIFCFLCIKGVVFRSRRCALCRQDVDLDYFKNPVIVKSGDTQHPEGMCGDNMEPSEGYQWYYEGRNGWWQYDDASSVELEKAHKDSKRSCELLIAGFLYFIDFDSMVQFRKTEPGRRRRIKRDVIDAEKKGVAGLRIENQNRLADDMGGTGQQQGDCESESSGVDNEPETLAIDRLVIGSSSDEEMPASQNRNPTS